MKIIKTGSNPQRGLSIAQEPIELLTSVDQLIVEADEASAVLPGLSQRSSLENSDVITQLSIAETAEQAIFTNPPTATEIVLAQRSERLSTRKVYMSKHGSYVIAPFGVTNLAASIIAGLNANIGLALPTTKIAKFMAMEQTLRNNMELTSARQVVLAQVANRNIRVTHMYAAASAFAVPFIFLRRVIENVRIAVNHLPRHGVGDISVLPFNDEEIQLAIAQVYTLSKWLPVMDPEFYDRVTQILEPTYTSKRTLGEPTLEVQDVCLGIPSNAVYTAAGSPLTGCAIDDAYMNSGANYMKLAGGPVLIDQVLAPTVLADALFQNNNTDAASRAALLAYIQGMVTWLSNIKSTYRDYLQYISFAESKSWLVLSRTEKYLPELLVSADGELSIDASKKFAYSHSKQIARDYAPIPMFREGTVNNTWSRIHAPLTISNNGLPRANALTGNGLSRMINLSNASDKVHTIDELITWGLHAIDDVSVSDALIDLASVTAINVFDGLFYKPMAIRMQVDVGNVISAQYVTNQFVFFMTNANKLNTNMVFDGAYLADITTELSNSPAANAQGSTVVMQHTVGRRRFRQAGFMRSVLYITNTVGEMEAILVDCENQDNTAYVEMSSLDFIKQCTPYYNVSLFDVAAIKTK